MSVYINVVVECDQCSNTKTGKAPLRSITTSIESVPTEEGTTQFDIYRCTDFDGWVETYLDGVFCPVCSDKYNVVR